MRHGLSLLMLTLLALSLVSTPVAHANPSSQALPLDQNWNDTSLISSNHSWNNLPGIVGIRGTGLTSGTGVDPQTLLAADDLALPYVNANQTSPNTYPTGGVTEFHLGDPVVALKGSGTANAPYLRLSLNTQGMGQLHMRYRLRDLDGSSNNSVQAVALHYRLGASGAWTNLPEGFVADATSGPDLATLETVVAVSLPVALDDQAVIQLRIMTADASGTDEWVGVDDLEVTGTPLEPTVVTLLDLRAEWNGEAVVLHWSTASEYALVGFVILRGTQPSADAAVVVSDLIYGEGDSVVGATYAWADPAPPPQAAYWLSVINQDGTPEQYGPVWVTDSAPTGTPQRIFLPLVGR